MRTQVLKVALSITISTAFIAGCGTSGSPTEKLAPNNVMLAIPSDCEKTGVAQALGTIVPGATYIPTKWQPAAGTELADFLNNGGLACSYGLQSSEIGATVKWVSNRDNLFEKRVTGWLADGFTKVTIPEFKNSEAYFLLKKQSPTQEFHMWILNVKYQGAWIQLSCSAFAQDFAAGLPLLKAAVK